jgi:hypothetical protein
MRPLSVLHVTPYWADAWAYGGIPRVVGTTTAALAAAGHRVTVCATDVYDATRRLAADGARATAVDLRIFPNRSNRLAHDWQCFTPVGLDAFLRDHARDFDVAHLHACRNLPGLIAARRLRDAGVPYVVQPNGTAINIERRRLAKQLVDAAGGRRMLARAAAVVAVSTAERAQLERLGVPPDRLHVVANPVDLGEFHPPVTRAAFRARVGVDTRPLVVFLGKITPRKRLDVVVGGFAAARADAHLVIAGHDMGGLDAARRAIGRLGVRQRCTEVGVLTGRDRLAALAAADVVVYPSTDEVFGLVAVEALLAGTPVIVAGDSGCGEVVGDLAGRGGGAMVVPAGDAAALAAAIDGILAAPLDWRQAAARAGRRAAERFGADRIAAEMVEVYRRAIGEDRAAARAATGVSVVVPVKNGAASLPRVIAALEAQADGRPFEIIAVDDGSADGGTAWLTEAAATGRIRLLTGRGAGAAAALNLGIAAARHPVIAQVDQDVEVGPHWLRRLVARLDADVRLGAVQGHYLPFRTAPLLARVTALDLDLRYAALHAGTTSHVCTGNTAYRAAALCDAGPFDERLGYGYDNDMSYRLRAAGWHLGHVAGAGSRHQWRHGWRGYWRQQYGFGYGRLDVVARHPRRISGDSVSPAAMMAHPVAFGLAIAAAVVSSVLAALGGAAAGFAAMAAVLVAALVVERLLAAARAFRRHGDPAAWAFPVVHLVRDAAWLWATLGWTARRLAGSPTHPGHSMQPRPAVAGAGADGFVPVPTRILVVVPVHNEASTIGAVVDDLRRTCARCDLLVVDDGSTDRTAAVLARLGVATLHLPERMGIGTAMRAGLRFARRRGYDAVVRVDGDGQHRADDIETVTAPLRAGRADVVLGSRFLHLGTTPQARPRVSQRALAVALAVITGRPVTDPTCGFSAIGPRALPLLADHHPTGYAEPELRLLLSRSGLAVEEAPVGAHPRRGGRTTLTPARVVEATLRVLLAMVMVPMRERRSGDDGG